MIKQKESMNFATELLNDMKRRLIICWMALIISLAGNVIQAAIWFFR